MRESQAFGTLIALALGLVTLAGGSLLIHAAPTRDLDGQDPAPPSCGRTHPDRGEIRAIDLEQVARSYSRIAGTLSEALERAAVEAPRALDRPYDLGLPACRARRERRIALPEPAPPSLRKRRLWFPSVDDASRVRPPDAVAGDPAAVVLVVAVPRLGELGVLARRLRRPVELAAPELVRILGVRCAGTVAEIEEDGDGAILREGD